LPVYAMVTGVATALLLLAAFTHGIRDGRIRVMLTYFGLIAVCAYLTLVWGRVDMSDTRICRRYHWSCTP